MFCYCQALIGSRREKYVVNQIETEEIAFLPNLNVLGSLNHYIFSY